MMIGEQKRMGRANGARERARASSGTTRTKPRNLTLPPTAARRRLGSLPTGAVTRIDKRWWKRRRSPDARPCRRRRR